MMRQSTEERDDERGLLDEKWTAKGNEGKSWKVWISSMLCLVVGFALGSFLHSIPRPTLKSHHTHSNVTVAPFERTLQITFQPNDTFAKATPGPEADAIWEKLMPLGRGFVQIQNSGDFIQHSNESENNLSDIKVVAAFHQVHCLNMLRKSLYASVENGQEFQYMVPQLEHHWRHCFDYLRQALMCNADVTLENLENGKDGRLLASVDGWGTTHMCRDWNELMKWAEGTRGTDDGGID